MSDIKLWRTQGARPKRSGMLGVKYKIDVTLPLCFAICLPPVDIRLPALPSSQLRVIPAYCVMKKWGLRQSLAHYPFQRCPFHTRSGAHDSYPRPARDIGSSHTLRMLQPGRQGIHGRDERAVNPDQERRWARSQDNIRHRGPGQHGYWPIDSQRRVRYKPAQPRHGIFPRARGLYTAHVAAQPRFG